MNTIERMTKITKKLGKVVFEFSLFFPITTASRCVRMNSEKK